MPRKVSSIAPDWWDYTTLDSELISDAAALSAEQMAKLSRSGFRVVFYDTLEEFYLADQGRILGTEEFVDATIHRIGETTRVVRRAELNEKFNAEALIEAVVHVNRGQACDFAILRFFSGWFISPKLKIPVSKPFS